MSCHRYFASYLTENFIETGSCLGKGIDAALKVGFKNIYSIEIDEARHNHCKRKFIKNPNVNLYLGDSITTLPTILGLIHNKSTFVLDAHVMRVEELHGIELCPIMQELEMVIAHGQHNGVRHNILIDDSKLFKGNTLSFNNIHYSDIIELIKKIDTTYNISINNRCIVCC